MIDVVNNENIPLQDMYQRKINESNKDTSVAKGATVESGTDVETAAKSGNVQTMVSARPNRDIVTISDSAYQELSKVSDVEDVAASKQLQSSVASGKKATPDQSAEIRSQIKASIADKKEQEIVAEQITDNATEIKKVQQGVSAANEDITTINYKNPSFTKGTESGTETKQTEVKLPTQTSNDVQNVIAKDAQAPATVSTNAVAANLAANAQAKAEETESVASSSLAANAQAKANATETSGTQQITNSTDSTDSTNSTNSTDSTTATTSDESVTNLSQYTTSELEDLKSDGKITANQYNKEIARREAEKEAQQISADESNNVANIADKVQGSTDIIE